MSSDQAHPFLTASIDEIVDQLTFEEKVGLLSGHTWWETKPFPHLDIPSIKVTDGPNGARGDSFADMTPALALPNAGCLAASFSHNLVKDAGRLLAEEAMARNATCLLAPTVNIARSPLGGRVFEAFSEDPTLSGHIATAYIRGLQELGVGAVIKHFVCNDQEFERTGYSAVVSDRALREIYLRPFQIAMNLSQPSAFMSGYNKLNGIHCSENKWLLDTLLRKEWGFEGIVMSDWYGTYSVADSIRAGLDLEMPGPGIWRNLRQVNHLINAHKLDVRMIGTRVATLLKWVQERARIHPEIAYTEPKVEHPRVEEKEADAARLRKMAGEGIVLLKNDRNVLPLTGGSIAVIGPNARTTVVTGGGSAILNAMWTVTAWDGLSTNPPDNISLDFAQGCLGALFLPVLDDAFACLDGSPGFELAHYPIINGEMASEPVIHFTSLDSNIGLEDLQDDRLGSQFFTEVQATFTAPCHGAYEFGIAVTGKGWIWVDDKLIVDNSKDQKRGNSFSALGSTEVRGVFQVVKGKKYRFRMLHDSRPPGQSDPGLPFGTIGVRIGASPVSDEEEMMTQAVQLATKSDIAICVCGLSPDWESEGFDRPDLQLPLRQDELIKRVSEANKKTIVVLQAGSALAMPWIEHVPAVLHAWYGGNETGNAIADVIYGRINPSGRLPLTFPKSEEDIAAFTDSKSARTQIHYNDDIWVGYKHHNVRRIEPLFPFGHGLSYTSFDYSDLEVDSQAPLPHTADTWKLGVSVTVTNTGDIAGSHSVHFYTCPPPETATGLKHPSHSFQAFSKVEDISPGQSKKVFVELDKYAISHWDEVYGTWAVESGQWSVKIGRNAQTFIGDAPFHIPKRIEWIGL